MTISRFVCRSIFWPPVTCLQDKTGIGDAGSGGVISKGPRDFGFDAERIPSNAVTIRGQPNKGRLARKAAGYIR